MPTYQYACPDGHVTEEYAGYEDDSISCACGETGRRLPCSGVHVINRTGDLGRPVTWEEKRQREDNARVQEIVTNNSKLIQAETGQKHGAGLRKN